MKKNKIKLKDCILYMGDGRVFVSDNHEIAKILICFSIFLKSNFCKDLEINKLDLKSMRDFYPQFHKKLDLKTKDYDREEVVYDCEKGPEDNFRFFINMDAFVSTNTEQEITLKGLVLLSYLIAERSNIDLVLDIIKEYLMEE